MSPRSSTVGSRSGSRCATSLRPTTTGPSSLSSSRGGTRRCWIVRQYREGEDPFDPLGLPPTDFPPDQNAVMGLDVAAQPSYDVVGAAFLDRLENLRTLLDAVTDSDLTTRRSAVMTPAWGVETHDGAECLRVLLEEYVSHRRYAERDLAIIEEGRRSGAEPRS